MFFGSRYAGESDGKGKSEKGKSRRANPWFQQVAVAVAIDIQNSFDMLLRS
jgi:hypothetical protein